MASIVLKNANPTSLPTPSAGKTAFGTNEDAQLYIKDDTGAVTVITSGGTVTSVGISGSARLSVSGSPITTSGTISLDVDEAELDLGSIGGTLDLTSQVTGALPIAHGGTGQTTASGALNALLPSQTGNTGKVLGTNGSSTSWVDMAAGSGTVTSVAVSGGTTGLTTSGGPITTSGTITLAGTLGIANGGTGQTTAAGAVGALISGLSSTWPTTNNYNPGYTTIAPVIAGVWSRTVNQLIAPCRVATTGNITLSGTQTIDGVAVVANDRVLVKNQTTSSQNGVYIASSGAWSRSNDLNGDAGTKDVGRLVAVAEGTQVALWMIVSSTPTFSRVSTQGGTVTSVGVTGSSKLTVSGSPITSSGTISLDVQEAALTLDNIGGTLSIAKGGTGQTTASGALNALLPSQTGNTGKVLSTDGSSTSWVAAATGTVTSVGISSSTLTVSGSPITTSGTITLDVQESALDLGSIGGTLDLTSQVTGALPIAHGGTGQTTAAAAAAALLPSQTGNTGKVLSTDGSSLSWVAAGSGSGTVTSVGVSSAGTYAGAISVSGSPVTSSGTISITPNAFTSSTAGVVPASGGGTSNYLRADGTWATPPGGGGGGDPLPSVFLLMGA